MQNSRHERNAHSKCGMRTSMVNICRPKRRRQCDAGKYFDGAMPQGRAAESKQMQQTRVAVGLVTTAAAKCEMRSSLTIIELSYCIVIAMFLIYRIVIDQKQYLTYRNCTSASIDRWCNHRWIMLRCRWMSTGQCF